MFRIFKTAVEILKEEEYSRFVKLSFNYIWQNLLFIPVLPYAIYKIRKIDTNDSLNKLVDFAFTFCFGLIMPLQIHFELLQLIKILNKEKPRYILEIGTGSGGTLFLFSRIASKDGVIISIDFPGGRFGGGYSNIRKPLYNSFSLKNQQICLIRKDSHDIVTFNEVKNILNGNKIDFLFIDGDHTYDGVKRDFMMYRSLVKRTGTIAFHDIVKCKVKDCEVSKFWDEIELKYDHIEIIEDRNQNWAGIGIIKNDSTV